MYKPIHFFTRQQSTIDEKVKKVQVLFRILAMGLGALHVYAAIKSQSMNADGISYLDIGDAYFHADWTNAINPVWSPLYSWILGFANFVIRPSIQWEFPIVHLVNFIIYLIALSSFEFMWKRIRIDEVSSDSYALSDFWWWTLGYLLFIWISLSLIEIWAVTPDLLMAVFVFLAVGLIAQMRAGERSRWSFLNLGLVLGFGYLSKSFMFPISIVFLVLAWIVLGTERKILLAVSVFLFLSLPFILLISEKKGKFTIGEAGTVTYLRYVNGMPFPHWQGDPKQGIVLTHQSRIVHRSPAVYEFDGPIGGTYPISTDPSYWYEGVEPRFDIPSLLTRLFAGGLVYAELFFHQQGIFLACIFALYIMRQGAKYSLLETLQRWVLVIPALVAFGLYGTVLVEGRYVGVFILLFWGDILNNIRLPNAPGNEQWLRVLSLIAAFGLLANIILFNLDGFARLNPSEQSRLEAATAAPDATPLAVARTLQELGVTQGDKVGVIGYAYDSFWARLARVRIVAEMLEADAEEFWRGDERLHESVLQAFAGAGVKAVVAEYVPEYARLLNWHQVGNSNYYIYIWR